MALAIILLAGAGVMIRSVLTIATSDLGVKTTRVLTALVGLPRGRYPTAQAQIAVVQQLGDRLKAVPGIESIALASALPAGAIFHPTKRDYEVADGRQLTDERLRPAAVAMAISAAYFQTIGATLYRGRAFTNLDGISSLPVAIVNQRFADAAWPGEDPMGKRLRLFRGSTPGSWLTVVGVSSNIVQDDRTGQRIEPVIYQPFDQEPSTVLWVLARTQLPPASLMTSVRRSIEATDADFLVGPGNSGVVAPLDEILRNNYRANSVNGILFLIFAAIALLLASVGLHAVVAHSVSQRTHEIGIRTAMGGSARDIVALIMREGMLPVGIGLVVGLPAALALTPILKSQLVNVSPADGATLVVASVTLVVSGAIGCWLPSRRAIRVDPMVALRHE
jgi:predicted permease